MNLMFAPIRKYAEFNGRSRRAEYWLFALFIWLLYMAIFIIGTVAGGSTTEGEPSGAIIGLIGLAFLVLFIPSLAVGVRRLHDINMSGWWLLLHIVPFGSLVLFVFSVLPGTKGPNRFGHDPKEPGPAGGEQTAIVFS